MAVDPKKLMALVQRENAVKPFQDEGGAPAEEAEETLEGEGEEEEEEEIIELSEQEIEAIAQMIEDGEGEPDLMELADQLVEEMEAAEEEEGVEIEGPPAWAAAPAIWAAAEKSVDPEGKGSKYTEPYAVLVHVYKRMGGSIA